jgi:hypothetical protein
MLTLPISIVFFSRQTSTTCISNCTYFYNSCRRRNLLPIKGALVTSNKMEEVEVDQTSVTMPTPNMELLSPGKLFTFPFLSGDNVELCAKGLSLCDYQSHITNEEQITLQLENNVGRSNILTF